MHSPEVEPDADRLSGVDGGHTKGAGGFGHVRRSGKFDDVVYVAAPTTVHYLDNRAIKHGDHYRFDAAAIRHPDLDAAATYGRTAAKSRPHHAATACGSAADVTPVRTDRVPVHTVRTAVDLDDTVQWARPMSEQQQESRGLTKWIGVVGLFIAPTTVIASLCYFYGYVSTRKYFSYFGIDTDAIGFTSNDYAIRSVRALLIPLVAGLLTYVALLWAGAFLRRIVQSGRRTLVRRLGWLAVTVGAVSIAWAIVSLTRPDLQPIHIDALTPVALGTGAALSGLGLWTLTSLQAATEPGLMAAARRASLAVAVGALVLALFWIIDIFAVAYGEDQGRITASRLWSQENTIVLDADAMLALPVPPEQIKVAWAPPAEPAAKPKFLRYQCFRSLAVHGDRWVLVPARWTPEYGYAVIVDADSAHVISVNMIKNIADKDAAKNRHGGWECPEVAPMRSLR